MVLSEISLFMCGVMQNFFNILAIVEIESGISLLDISTAIYFMSVVVGFYMDVTAVKKSKDGSD